MSDPRMAAEGNTSALSWDSQKQALLDRLNVRLAAPAGRDDIHLAARRFLELLRAFSEIPTPEQVARAVFAHDWPRDGWLGWDWDKWRGYTPRVIEALQSADPARALYL